MFLTMNESIVCITSDLDWVSDEILLYELELIEDFNINITIFCTHSLNIKITKHELAIHPYFRSIDSEEEEIIRLRKIFPNAVGARAHSLYFRSSLVDKYIKYGFIYDSSYLCPLQINITPFYIKNLIEIPIFFGDYYFLSLNNKNIKNFDYNLLLHEGIKVFNIHPIHVYLNTCDLNQYLKYKKYGLQNNIINNKTYGIRDFLVDLLEFIERNDIQTMTLAEVATEFLKAKAKNNS